MAEHETSPTEKHEGEHDLFVSITVKAGPKFWGGDKHGTNQEIAAVLKRYASQYNGALREVFSLFAEYHLRVAAPVPVGFEGTGGPTDTITYGYCGSCKAEGGGPGYATYIGGVEVNCTPCP